MGLGCSTGEEAKPAPALAVYLPDYRAKSEVELTLHGTTDLILFAAKPTEKGAVDFTRITPALLATGKAAREKDGVAVTVCVGGWGSGKTFAKAVATEANRTQFVDDLAAFCETHQLAGVDIDWEFPQGDKEHADFALFLAALSKKLRAADRQLTVALGYTRPLPAECWPHIDRVHLMSYQPWTPQEYEPWLAGSIQRFLDAGLPPEKLLVGIGFFANEKDGKRRAVSWRKLAGESREALPESEHGFWQTGPGMCDLRVRLVKEFGLGGVMVWEYGHDTDDPKQSLLRHLSEGMGLVSSQTSEN